LLPGPAAGSTSRIRRGSADVAGTATPAGAGLMAGGDPQRWFFLLVTGAEGTAARSIGRGAVPWQGDIADDEPSQEKAGLDLAQAARLQTGGLAEPILPQQRDDLPDGGRRVG
jgi:hypothetical protein